MILPESDSFLGSVGLYYSFDICYVIGDTSVPVLLGRRQHSSSGSVANMSHREPQQ